jgi:hypothetical protein|tara:strand:- start:71 stop:691 length:621 start_codon:yes stop_codon:yes gene_type:complete
MSSEIKVDTISEKTSANGVVIDGVTVKDGAIASSFISGLSSAGLTKLADTDFSGASDVTFDSVFSSTYRNYRITIYTENANNNTEFNFRFRDGGGDISASNYNVAAMYGLSSSATPFANKVTYGQGVTAGAIASGMGQNTPYNFSVDVWDANIAHETSSFAIGSNANGHTFLASNSYNAATQLTGIKFFQSAGNITGSIQIYGYDT